MKKKTWPDQGPIIFFFKSRPLWRRQKTKQNKQTNKKTLPWALNFIVFIFFLLLFKCKTIKNHKTMIQITKQITGNQKKRGGTLKAGKLQYGIIFTCTRQPSIQKWDYKWPFLKVKGQFTSSFSNRMFNFPFWFNKRFYTIKGVLHLPKVSMFCSLSNNQLFEKKIMHLIKICSRNSKMALKF